jgi:hypothetical protein
MTLTASFSSFFATHLVEPFVNKPGLHVAQEATKALTVSGGLAADHWTDTFVQAATGVGKNLKTGRVLDMMPEVKGGIQAGDIVLRGWSTLATAESGWGASATESLRTGHAHIQKSAVSHVAVVVKDPAHAGELRVIQWVDDPTPKDLEDQLTRVQKAMGATFLQNVPLHDFFNPKGAIMTDAVVMRPQDAKLADAGAKRALELFNTQVVSEPGKATVLRPWYPKIPHSLAPDGRGGPCSGMVNVAFDDHFRQAAHIPVTPEHFILAGDLTNVGETSISKIEALAK